MGNIYNNLSLIIHKKIRNGGTTKAQRPVMHTKEMERSSMVRIKDIIQDSYLIKFINADKGFHKCSICNHVWFYILQL